MGEDDGVGWGASPFSAAPRLGRGRHRRMGLMPIPGRMPTKDMCARALASLRLSALPSCRAPLSPLGSRASRLCGQRLRAGRGCSPPPRHVADGHPARHRARPRRTGGRDLAQAGCVHGGRCESGSGSLQRVQYPRRAHRSPPRRLGDLRSAENTPQSFRAKPAATRWRPPTPPGCRPS